MRPDRRARAVRFADRRRGWQIAIRDIGGNLETLEPGMAATIRICSEGSIEWEQPLTPARGLVTLYSGENWVAWNGRNQWPLDEVVRDIGWSLVSIELRVTLDIWRTDRHPLQQTSMPFASAA